VTKGMNVLKGQPIAKSGNNRFEKAEKNHLHFEVRKDGKAVNPNSVLPKRPMGEAKSTTAPQTNTETKPSTTNPGEVTSSTSTTPAQPAEKKTPDATKKPDAGNPGTEGKTEGKHDGSAKSTDGLPDIHQ
jgi:stage II sporulation protein Q